MAKIPQLNRRTLLRGLGGTALALPWLEVMEPRRAGAAATTMPKRYAVLYGSY